jgi:hypothetical protein
MHGTGKALTPWKKGDRMERIGRFALEASPEEVFPLLCPVREYEWLPGWACTMVYSDSGVAEKDAIFLTRETLGRGATWTLITYDPPRFVEYLIVSGKDAVIRLSIGLESSGGKSTEVTWRMLFTACSRLGRVILPRHFSQERFDGMMSARKAELSAFLAGRPLARGAGLRT